METFKIGMYVRVSVDYEEDRNPRMFALGQIEEIEDDYILVIFYKNYRKNDEDIIHNYIPSEKKYKIEDINRVKVLKNSKVIHGFDIGEVIAYSHTDDEGYYNYLVKSNSGKISTVKEKEIMVDFNRANVDPYKQIKNYEFHNPFWYAKRKVGSESINIINNFGDGFKTLISSRVYLFEHQIDSIVRALNEKECRLMLADEVGLGKTVEALVILKGLKKKKERVLIIVPEALVNQWHTELELKFWMSSTIYNGSNINDNDIIIVSTERILEIPLNKIEGKFDYCVIDEVHRAVGDEFIYRKLYDICKCLSKVLLLSATPIQNRKEEYLKLLKLLKPSMYGEMTETEFTDLYNKNKIIKRIVHRVCRELPEVYGNVVDIDGVEEIFERLERIADQLEDKCLDKMIDELDENSEDNSEAKVREILAYISINYQFEKNIIRHRREELKEILPERNLETIYYDMKSGLDNYFERNCYEETIKYIESIKENNQWDYGLGEYIRVILNALFSSPWALKSIVTERKKILKNRKINSEKIKEGLTIQRNYRKKINELASTIQTYDNELKDIENIEIFLDRWIKAADIEIKNISELIDDPDMIKGRLPKICDYMEQELYENKIVIFTSWIETLEKIKEILEKLYGSNSISTFSINDSTSELEVNVARFQNDDECRFMICDELGGEGRNFQVADAIVHIDIPFAPTVLEQRIGRLDRIGRKKDKEVLNIVVVSEDTIEMSLFDLWNDGLNIFKESLSGLEIALEDINKEILMALKENMKYGLSDAMDNIKVKLNDMKTSVAEERYYDMARQLDYNTKKRYDSVINHFDNEGGKLLADMMLNWSRAIGFVPISSSEGIIEFGPGSITDKCMQHTMFSIPDTSKSLEKSTKENIIRGTFDRNLAVNKEDLVFFAPGEEIFDSIMTNVEEGYRGKATGIRVTNTPYQWEGFIFKWNATFRIKELIDNGIDINYSNYAYGNMPIEQYTSIVTISDNEYNLSEIKKYINNDLNDIIEQKSKYRHIGQRSGANPPIIEFKKHYPKNIWVPIVKQAFKESKEEFFKAYSGMVDIKKMKREFSAIYAGAKASEKYFNGEEKSEELKNILQSVIKGIVKPEISVDSIMYLKLEK